MKKLFDYSNYREYLNDLYHSQKEKTTFFSYQYFANKIGFKSKDFIYRVIRGQRNLSRTSCFLISNALKHTDEEAKYFDNLVALNQSKSEKERQYFQKSLDKLSLIINNSKVA